jgi:hypothetical protein
VGCGVWGAEHGVGDRSGEEEKRRRGEEEKETGEGTSETGDERETVSVCMYVCM